MDIAASIQAVTEEVVIRLARTLHKETGERYLCLAGGVALNCVANGRILREGPFDDIWIQPAAGDAGGALGAALCVWHEYFGGPRMVEPGDAMRGGYLGPRFGRDEIKRQLDAMGAVYVELDDEALLPRVAALMDDQNVVGWFQGRMEFGPRALGGRSIIGDPRSAKMQSVMNLKIKHRESFRPFAPAVLGEDVDRYFALDRGSPYMLIVAPVREDLRLTMTDEQSRLFGIEKLNLKRSQLPAVTHVDFSARIQTVHEATNPRFHRLLREFKARTGCGVLVNTSFNVRGEPIVGAPTDAYRCFMRTEMDCLVVENFLLLKAEQPKWEKDDSWMKEFELD
jgi:carbamoyltransferase